MRKLSFDHLGEPELERVVEVLAPFVSPERRARIDRVAASRTRELVLVMEDIYDEHNASAVLRSADAFGVLEVHVVERSVRFQLQAKTSIGAHKWIELHRYKEAREVYARLASRGYAIWASSVLPDAVPIGDLDVSGKIALVFGNEHQGLSEEAARTAHGRFHVPMHGFVESLNVSVATALSMYDVLGRKRSSSASLGLPLLEVKRLRAEWMARSVRGARPILERAGLSAVEAKVPVVFVEGGAPEEEDEG